MGRQSQAKKANDKTIVASESRIIRLVSETSKPAAEAADGISADEELREFATPSRVGHFELLDFLGKGGMGEVYKAQDTRLDRTVALKLLLPGPEAVEQRFQREARAQAKIHHDAVCSVFEVGNANGRSFISMQYLEGQTLGESAGQLTLEEKVLVIRQVAEAIHAAHTQALVHRDLKPGNIMVQTVDSSLKAWVLDFGMVHIGGDAQLTSTGEVLGSPFYMAPEQISGELGVIDRRTDVYGLGAVFYELLVGQPPFEGRNVIEVLRKVSFEEPVPPRQLRPEIPEDLAWIVLRCLEKKPGQRYPSARVLIEDLDRFRRGEAVRARQSSWRYRSTKWLFRHRRGLAAAAAALILISGLAWRDLAQRSAARETAQLTANFLREKKELEWRLRAISMLPLHDTRPERERLMERVGRLEAQVHAAGKIGQPPGFFALGRGYQVLGLREKGLDYLEQSWAEGFRDPRLAFSLGLAYSELYDESLARLDLEPDPERRQQQRREIEARYRTPAIQRLEEAEQGRREDSEWVVARVAAHEQRWDQAFDALQEVQKNSPWFYETHALEALIWHRQALELGSDKLRHEAEELLERAEQALDQAIRIGSSDPALYIKLCYQRKTRITVFDDPLPETTDDRWQLLVPCQQAIQADSGSTRAYAMAARMARSLGEALMRHEPEPDRDSQIFLKEAERLANQAIVLNPDHISALEELNATYRGLAQLADSGASREAYLDRAHQIAVRRQALEPRTPESESS